jgi:hypothetical protein
MDEESGSVKLVSPMVAWSGANDLGGLETIDMASGSVDD